MLYKKEDLKKALDTLHDGGLILCPTDTVWGISCDATNEGTIQKIHKIKRRDPNKRMIILLDHENRLPSYVREVPDIAYDLIEYTERPLTIIFPGAKNLPPSLLAPDGSIGIRIVNHPFCTELIRRFRRPIVSTSANLSGQQTPVNFDLVDDIIKDQVDYVVQFGQEQNEPRQPSIIMKLDVDGQFEFLRK